MNSKFFLSAIASGIFALAIGGSAIAASGGVDSKPMVVNHGTIRDVVLEAGTDPSTVQLHFAGARKITFVDVGTVQITAADGTSWRYRPTLYQTVNGKKRQLSPGFRILGRDRLGLSVSGQDPSAPMVLGPVG